MSDAIERLHNLEDSFTERKTEGAANKAELRKTLVAFANSVEEGRTAILYIGITDSGEMSGVQQADSLQRTVNEVCNDDCYPAIRVVPEIITVNDKHVLAIVVPHSEDRPHFAGPAFVRRGAQSIRASREMFEELILSRQSKPREILKWKNQVVTVISIGKHVGDPRILTPAAVFRYDCMVIDCDAHNVRLLIIGEDRYVSEPLENILISRDEARYRLQLTVRHR